MKILEEELIVEIMEPYRMCIIDEEGAKEQRKCYLKLVKFISNLIRKTLSDQLKEIEGKLPVKHIDDKPRAWGFRRVKWMDEGFDSCLSQIKSILKETKEGVK